MEFTDKLTISAGITEYTGKGRSGSGDLQDIAKWAWPDLAKEAALVVIPKEDYDVIIAATAGRGIYAVRPAVVCKMPREVKKEGKGFIRQAIDDILDVCGGWLIVLCILHVWFG